MARRSPSPRTVLAAVVLALLVGSLAPADLVGWVGWFRGPFMAVIAPISGPLSALSVRLRPSPDRADPRDLASRGELLEENERLYVEALDLKSRVLELEGLVRDLQGGVGAPGELRWTPLEATRVGADPGSGTIEVKGGRRQGVAPGTVAVARRSSQLVGPVTAVGPMTSTVHLVTDTGLRPALMIGVVVPDGTSPSPEALAEAVRCQLRPEGDGTLLSEPLGADDAERVSVGDPVHLDDDSWPSTASMLTLGRVTAVLDTDNPLFKQIVVTPGVDPARLRSVILRVPGAETAPGTPWDGAAGPGADPGVDPGVGPGVGP